MFSLRVLQNHRLAISRRGAVSLAASVAALVAPHAGAGTAPNEPAMVIRATQQGMASWHVPDNAREARHTASERVWKNDEFVAAHRTLPLGAKARVVNLENNLSVVVEITDRGPYKKGRIIDLSLVAAIRLGMVTKGTARVRVEEIVEPDRASVRVTSRQRALLPLDVLAVLASTPPQDWPLAA